MAIAMPAATDSVKARALAHLDTAISALANDPPKVLKAGNHLQMARALVEQLDGGGGISPMLLIGGAAVLYMMSRK